MVEEWGEDGWQVTPHQPCDLQVVEGVRIPGDIKVSPATIDPVLLAPGGPPGPTPAGQVSTSPSTMEPGELGPEDHGAITSTILSSRNPGHMGASTHGVMTETTRTEDLLQTDEYTRTTNGESTSKKFYVKETSETINTKTTSKIQETPSEYSKTTSQMISELATSTSKIE